MRKLKNEEKALIICFASKLKEITRLQLLNDVEKVTARFVAPDGSRIEFEIAGYERPLYRGQHPFEVEGRMLDGDGTELSVLLHADENDRLLELELIRWDASDLVAPQWETLTLH